MKMMFFFSMLICKENDIIVSADRESFKVIKDDQRLNCEFEDYPNLCVKMIRTAKKEHYQGKERIFWPEFTIHHDGSGRLEIRRKSKIKVFTVLIIDFSPMPDKVVKKNITYRFGALSSKISMMEARVMEIYNVLGKKNPSLLLKVQKETE